MRSPSSRTRSVGTCQGLRPRRAVQTLAITRLSVLPSASRKASAPRNYANFVVQWLAYAIPYRRFADTLTEACARLGANVDRYSFITADSHHLLLASLLAHSACGLKTVTSAFARYDHSGSTMLGRVAFRRVGCWISKAAVRSRCPRLRPFLPAASGIGCRRS